MWCSIPSIRELYRNLKAPEVVKVHARLLVTKLHKLTISYLPLTLAVDQSETVYDIPQEIMHRLPYKCSNDALTPVSTRRISRDIHCVRYVPTIPTNGLASSIRTPPDRIV
jgi:hypothetical protein